MINIKASYPESWKLLVVWYQDNRDTAVSPYHYRNDATVRGLYDFFDAMGIKIGININYNPNCKFQYQIHHPAGYEVSATHCSQRKECETQAFMKAFEILENHIKNDEGK